GLLAVALAEPLSVEHVAQLPLRAFPARERLCAGGESNAAAQLAPQGPEARPVELEAGLEAASRRYVERDRAPAFAVELNEHGAFPGNARAVDDVEFGLLERGRDLVLDDLDADAVAVGLHAFLERLDPADVEPDRRVELQRAAARGRLRVPEHDADLLAELV